MYHTSPLALPPQVVASNLHEKILELFPKNLVSHRSTAVYVQHVVNSLSQEDIETINKAIETELNYAHQIPSLLMLEVFLQTSKNVPARALTCLPSKKLKVIRAQFMSPMALDNEFYIHLFGVVVEEA